MGQCEIGKGVITHYRGLVRVDLTADEKRQRPFFGNDMQEIAEAEKFLDLEADGTTISDTKYGYEWLREWFSVLEIVGESHEEEEL